jgi:hypothetical protein
MNLLGFVHQMCVNSIAQWVGGSFLAIVERQNVNKVSGKHSFQVFHLKTLLQIFKELGKKKKCASLECADLSSFQTSHG